MSGALADHVETFRVQGRFAAISLRKSADLLERLLQADELDPAALDQLRSQLGAALQTARSTKQLAAQAAALIQASTAEGGTAHGTSSTRTNHIRVG